MLSAAWDVELGFLGQPLSAPQVQREQRIVRGSHGVTLPARVFDDASRWPCMPFPIVLLPGRRTREGNIDLVRVMGVRRIMRLRTQKEKSTRQLLTAQPAMHADELGPRIILEKFRFDLMRLIGLPPGELRS